MTWPAALLVLALLFLGACSSNSSQMGSGVTGPSPQTANGPQGGSRDGGTDTSGGGGSHM